MKIASCFIYGVILPVSDISARQQEPGRHWMRSGFLPDGLSELLKGHYMLGLALLFLVVAIIAGVLGLTGIAGISANIAWILFVVFLVLFVLSMVVRAFQGRSVV